MDYKDLIKDPSALIVLCVSTKCSLLSNLDCLNGMNYNSILPKLNVKRELGSWKKNLLKTNNEMFPVVVRWHCLAEGIMLSRGIASVVIFCVSVSLLNKLLPHNVSFCQQSLYCLGHWVLETAYIWTPQINMSPTACLLPYWCFIYSRWVNCLQDK